MFFHRRFRFGYVFTNFMIVSIPPKKENLSNKLELTHFPFWMHFVTKSYNLFSSGENLWQSLTSYKKPMTKLQQNFGRVWPGWQRVRGCSTGKKFRSKHSKRLTELWRAKFVSEWICNVNIIWNIVFSAMFSCDSFPYLPQKNSKKFPPLFSGSE